jgi:hypothetical protein
MSMPGIGDLHLSFQHHMGQSGAPQTRRGRQTRRAGANDHNVFRLHGSSSIFEALKWVRLPAELFIHGLPF